MKLLLQVVRLLNWIATILNLPLMFTGVASFFGVNVTAWWLSDLLRDYVPFYADLIEYVSKLPRWVLLVVLFYVLCQSLFLLKEFHPKSPFYAQKPSILWTFVNDIVGLSMSLSLVGMWGLTTAALTFTWISDGALALLAAVPAAVVAGLAVTLPLRLALRYAPEPRPGVVPLRDDIEWVRVPEHASEKSADGS